jgi:hypothetical protein
MPSGVTHEPQVLERATLIVERSVRYSSDSLQYRACVCKDENRRVTGMMTTVSFNSDEVIPNRIIRPPARLQLLCSSISALRSPVGWCIRRSYLATSNLCEVHIQAIQLQVVDRDHGRTKVIQL